MVKEKDFAEMAYKLSDFLERYPESKRGRLILKLCTASLCFINDNFEEDIADELFKGVHDVYTEAEREKVKKKAKVSIH